MSAMSPKRIIWTPAIIKITIVASPTAFVVPFTTRYPVRMLRKTKNKPIGIKILKGKLCINNLIIFGITLKGYLKEIKDFPFILL